VLRGRALHIAAHEAIARDQEVGPEHLLLGLPDHGPHPIRLLVERRGLTLDRLRTALLTALDQGQ
jgi:hypothetical protein